MLRCVIKLLLPVILFCNLFSLNVLSFENDDLLHEDAKDPISVFNNTYSSVSIDFNDVELMAQVVFGESRAEPYEGKVAVASVIINRVLSDKFPMSVEDVVKQKGAFSCVVNGNINYKPDRSCYSAVYDALKGIDPTNDALFFYNPDISTCNWMKSVSKNNVIIIGNHVFFISE